MSGLYMNIYSTAQGKFVPWDGSVSGASGSGSSQTLAAGGTAIVQGSFATGTSAAGGTAIVQGNFAVGTSAAGGTAIVQFSSGSATQAISGTVALFGSGAAGTALVTGTMFNFGAAAAGTMPVSGTVALFGSGAAGTALVSASTVFNFGAAAAGTLPVSGTVALLGSQAAGTVFVTGTVALFGSGAAGTALVTGSVALSGTGTVSLSSATLVGIVSTGTPYDIIMQPVVQAAGSSSNAAQYLSDATGWNKLQFTLIGFASTSGAAVVISWSTTASDQSTCKTQVDSITTLFTGKFAVPDGSIILNTHTMPAIPGTSWEIEMDTTTPVKTFGVGLTNPVPGCLVQVTGLRAG